MSAAGGVCVPRGCLYPLWSQTGWVAPSGPGFLRANCSSPLAALPPVGGKMTKKGGRERKCKKKKEWKETVEQWDAWNRVRREKLRIWMTKNVKNKRGKWGWHGGRGIKESRYGERRKGSRDRKKRGREGERVRRNYSETLQIWTLKLQRFISSVKLFTITAASILVIKQAHQTHVNKANQQTPTGLHMVWCCLLNVIDRVSNSTWSKA